MKNLITNALMQSIEVKNKILADDYLLDEIVSASQRIIEAYNMKKKILIAGNGGSAGDAQHMAAEFVGRYLFDRPPLPAIALTTNTSAITAIGNDYGYAETISRQLEANGESGDIFIAISTSGDSKNIIKALEKAKEIKIMSIGMTGSKGGSMSNLCDICFRVPSDSTPRIQEAHICIIHSICEIVESFIFETYKRI